MKGEKGEAGSMGLPGAPGHSGLMVSLPGHHHYLNQTFLYLTELNRNVWGIRYWVLG